MDLSNESTVQVNNEKEGVVSEPVKQPPRKSTDPIEALRELLVDAIATPPEGETQSKAAEKSTEKTDLAAEKSESKQRGETRDLFWDKRLEKPKHHLVNIDGGWKTIAVEHERLEASGKHSPNFVAEDKAEDLEGLKEDGSGESLRTDGIEDESEPTSEGGTGDDVNSAIAIGNSSLPRDEKRGETCPNPESEVRSPTPKEESLETIAQDNQQLQEEADTVLAGFEQLASLIVGEDNPQEEAREKTEPATENAELSEDPMENLQHLLLGSKIAEINQLKNLLSESDLPGLRELLGKIDRNLQTLEHQIYEPQELIDLLKPWIAEILSRKIADSKDEVSEALVPIIDEVIKNRSRQDKGAMSEAIASVLPTAIARQITEYPEDVAKAIAPEMAIAIKEQIRLDRNAISQVLAPEMGRTIKEQIRLERDAMVDALYPVIGNTISKYMVEVINSINEKVSNALSMEGVQRKIRAKMQGVSEAELILRESVPFVIQAIFLIHKASGLVIAEQQQTGSYRLESEMVAGMLTAIRSFVNDCIVQPGEVSELNEVEYGDSKIILEVGGYCYLAVVVKGDPPPKFIKKMRQTVSTLILDYGEPIEQFDGDPESVPLPIHQLIERLMEIEGEKPKPKPYALVGVTVLLLSLICIPFGIFQYQNAVNRNISKKVELALNSTPELAIYPLDVKTEGNTVTLSGKLPNREMREKASAVISEVVPNRKLDNQIIPVEVPPDPVLVGGEVERVNALLNQMDGVSISSAYRNRKVTVTGTVMEMEDANKITQAFEKIPGVKSVVNTIKLDPLNIRTRIYFASGSAALNPGYEESLASLREFLQQYPEKKIRIIGHSDRTGKAKVNERLALKRATTVRDALVKQGVDPKRLEAIANPKPPNDVEAHQPHLLGRVVLFEPIPSGEESQ